VTVRQATRLATQGVTAPEALSLLQPEDLDSPFDAVTCQPGQDCSVNVRCPVCSNISAYSLDWLRESTPCPKCRAELDPLFGNLVD